MDLLQYALLGSLSRDGFAHEKLITFIKESVHETAPNIQKHTGEKLVSGNKPAINQLYGVGLPQVSVSSSVEGGP